MKGKKRRKKETHIEGQQTEGQTYKQGDHRVRIFASLYTIIKNKMGDIF